MQRKRIVLDDLDRFSRKAGWLVILLVCVATMFVTALPAAANNKPITGTPLPLGPLGPSMFPANTPFHINHGFTCELGDGNCLGAQISANAGFDLYLDGVLQPSSVDVNRDDGALSKLYLTNYPAGLPAGTYTFGGIHHEGGIVVLTRTKTITFT